MFDLMKFEFKKLLARRTSQVVSAGILRLLCGIMALNVVQTKTDRVSGRFWAALRPSPSAKRRTTRTKAC